MARKKFNVSCPECGRHLTYIGEDSYVEITCHGCGTALWAKSSKIGVKVTVKHVAPTPNEGARKAALGNT